MDKSKISSRVFFVVRYYGGTKLGPKRFHCILQAVEDVAKKNIPELSLTPENEELQANQQTTKTRKSGPKGPLTQKRKYNYGPSNRVSMSQSQKRGLHRRRHTSLRGRGSHSGSQRNQYKSGHFLQENNRDTDELSEEWPSLRSTQQQTRH